MERKTINRHDAAKRPLQGEPKVAAIFVHGFSSTPEGTWKPMLNYVRADTSLCSVTFGTYTYPTKLISWGIATMPRIQELADGLRTEILTNYGGFDRIVIVCHSMGGVISRYFLMNEKKNNRDISRYYLSLYAVPTLGAKIAGFGSFFSFQHFHLSQLNTNSDIIRIINEDWKSLQLAEIVPTLCVVGTGDRVVTIDSARALARSEDIRTVHYNHRTITRPDSETDERFVILKNFLQCVIQNGAESKSVESAQTDHQAFIKTGDPLFLVYRPEHKAFYLKRSVDVNLLSNQQRHFWIYGPSGVGKTSALRYNAFEDGIFVQVGLSGHGGRRPHELLAHIADSLAEVAGVSRTGDDTDVPSSLAIAVRAAEALATANRVVIAIEEIPRQDHRSWEQFLANLLALCLAFDTLSESAPKVIIALTSIDNPINGVSIPARFRERIRLVPMESWTPQEAGQLTDLLAEAVRPALSGSDRHEISNNSDRLPRTIKQVFRIWHEGGAEGRSVREILDEVSLERSR